MPMATDPRWFAVTVASGRGLGPAVIMVRGDVTLHVLHDRIRERGFKHIQATNEVTHQLSETEWAAFKSHDRIIRPDPIVVTS